ncbi:MAG: RimK family alpha-L-glutamate ligase [Promethearchaeota archaeon]
MKIGIAMARERRNWPTRRLAKAFGEQGCEVKAFCLKDVTVHLSTGDTVFMLPRRHVLDVEAVILRSIGGGSTDQITSRISVLECMEFAGIRVFNRTYSHRRAKDKLATLVWLAHKGIPIPDTTITERMAAALAATRRHGDVVSKPLRGSQGQGVLRLQDLDLAFRIFKVLQTADQIMFIQKFIETPQKDAQGKPIPPRDIRVMVVGGRALGAMYRYAKPGKWKANVAQGGRPKKCPLTAEIEELAVKAANALEMDFAGIDLLEAKTGLLVSECNSAPNWAGFQKVTGIDVAQEIADHVLQELRA